MIMGDSFNEQLKRKGLFVDGMVANFGSHDWGVIQIGTEVQQIITTTGRGYIMLNNNLTDEEFREKCINDTAHLLTNFEYRSRGVLVTLPPYIHSHPTKWEILKNVFVVSARRFNFGMLEPRFSQNNAYPLFVNEVGEPTARGILDYIGTLRAAIPGFPLKEEEIGPIAAHDDRPPTPIRLPTPPPPPAPPVERPTKKKSRLDVPPEVEKENRNLGGASGSGRLEHRRRSSFSLQDRTMASRWGPSTPPDMGRVRVFEESLNDRSCSFQDRTSEGKRGPQAFQNVNGVRDPKIILNNSSRSFQDGTWDTNCMEQSTSQPVDRVRVFKRKLSENDRSFNFQNQTFQQNWDENMVGTSTNAFGECWRGSVTQRGNPELIPKYISAAIIGSQVDKLSQQIEDYYEFHQQIDEETERKQRVFKIIKDAIKERKVWYPELTTASVTGSSSTQLAAFESDLDLTFATTKPLSIEKKLEILRGLQHVFGRREFDFYNIDIIPSNRVPVLEMKYMEKGRRRPTLNIDITIGNDNASTHNTLINNWTANDPRFIPLAFFSKAWFKHIGAGNSRNEGFNSISIIFLLGYYLIKEEVLPKETNANFVSKNNNSLGQLFICFLQFLHQFDFENTAISIFHGVSFPKKLTGNNNRYEVVILDPSSVGPIEYASNTARCVRSGGLTKLAMALGKLQRLQEEEINFDSLFQAEYPGKWSSWWNGPRNYTTENCELVSTDLFRMGTKSMSSPILDVQHCNYEDGFCNLNDSLLVWQVECRTPGCEPCSYKYGWSWFGKAWKNEFLEESGENSLTWSALFNTPINGIYGGRDLFSYIPQHFEQGQSSTQAIVEPDIEDRQRLNCLMILRLESLRSAAKASSQHDGQGFKYCNSGCGGNRCSCKKEGKMCSSKCHKSLSCSNT
uniref:PAP-associated domain-containing protein n=1 Tax=Meloidogyne floridensis TaxID=298350 RepID=A0A915P514_9BILA